MKLVFFLVTLPELDLTLPVANVEYPVVAVVHGTSLAGEGFVAGFAALLADPFLPIFIFHRFRSSSSETTTLKN